MWIKNLENLFFYGSFNAFPSKLLQFLGKAKLKKQCWWWIPLIHMYIIIKALYNIDYILDQITLWAMSYALFTNKLSLKRLHNLADDFNQYVASFHMTANVTIPTMVDRLRFVQDKVPRLKVKDCVNFRTNCVPF